MRYLPLVFLLGLAGCSDDDDDDGAGPAPMSITGSLAGLGLNTLGAAAVTADLADDLDDPMGTFTLFGPTEAAFAALPPGVLSDLLLPANQADLIDLLSYHVLTLEADSMTAMGLSGATALNGDDLLIDVIGGELYINDARVVGADRMATNGFIHEVDRVLTPPQGIVETLNARGFTTLLTAAVAAELDDDLAGPGPFTVLAPTEAAFAALPAGVLSDLLLPMNQGDLIDILSYHVIPGAGVRASDALAGETAATLQGSSVLFSGVPTTGIVVNGVTISSYNIPCDNGVIHVIDAVLTPPADIPTLATDLGFPTLVAALVAAELDDDLAGAGPFTVFAPTEAAFAALPASVLSDLLLPANQALLIDVLTYHVVVDELTANEVVAAGTLTTLGGDDVTITNPPPQVNGTDISVTNVLASNGIIHAIDAVLLPPGFVPPAPLVMAEDTASRQREGTESGLEQADLFNLMREAGPDAVPGWTASGNALVAGWNDFDAAGAAPIRPDVDGSSADGVSLMVATPGYEAADGRIAFTDLNADLRVDVESETVPFEVVLQLRGQNLDSLEPSLRLALPEGVLELAADELRQLPSGEWLAVWRPVAAGASADGFDVVLEASEQGLVIEAVRFFAMP